jgi:flagellar biosynthesis/type III secretory pathway protein FliH
MNSSSSVFAPGLGLGAATPFAFLASEAAPRPGTGPNIFTAPTGSIRPVMFGQLGAAINAKPTDDLDAMDADDTLDMVEPEPAPPPPDYEAIKAEAWREGFDKGYDEGVHLATQEQQATTARLGALIQGIATDTEQFVRSLEGDIIELALAVAEKVIAREVRTERGLVVNVVRAALAEVHDATELRIRVHPEDYALIEPRWQEMLPRSVAQQSELLSDELVERGGCAVETRIGYVDGQIKTRLGQIVNAFQGVLDGEPV